MSLLGHNDVSYVMLALGIEQEFFIVPKKDF
jgi:glutamine synthetase type III